ncbi:anthranilate phosphoribosyltransferase [Tothia fuscella]|uniref:Anthranilate phosphoribosyltransferase n=1 Tax=Tothia fuscella TaxID=1048955 RepID=A0A9P4TZ54_9PEZI|nr:anthranilate phosphoribosyltransferase [Tothia fuscella]
MDENAETIVLITPLLKRMWPAPGKENVTAAEIAAAISHIFTNSLTPVQTGALLTALHFTGLDRQPEVLSRCAQAMRNASSQIDKKVLREVISKRGRKEGSYRGGLCDIVGTGGDSHNTFNISTTSSIIASSLLLIAKHGNRASTSKSGSADLLRSIAPKAPILENVTPTSIAEVYSNTNYAFLFAPTFHPGMRYVAPIRKELGWRTIFNLLGPLSNPVDSTGQISASSSSISLVEARLIGVARKDLGGAFAQSLVLSGARKALVVCGDEELDELSCAGPTHCWMLREKPNPDFKGSPHEEDDDLTTSDEEAPPRNLVNIENFTLSPSDFGFPEHPLSTVGPGKEPSENAETLLRILRGEMGDDDPLMHFVLINTASLFVVSGICDGDSSSMGGGDDGKVITEKGPGGGRWKEGVRRARWAIKSGAALRELERFIEVTNAL